MASVLCSWPHNQATQSQTLCVGRHVTSTAISWWHRVVAARVSWLYPCALLTLDARTPIDHPQSREGNAPLTPRCLRLRPEHLGRSDQYQRERGGGSVVDP